MNRPILKFHGHLTVGYSRGTHAFWKTCIHPILVQPETLYRHTALCLWIPVVVDISFGCIVCDRRNCSCSPGDSQSLVQDSDSLGVFRGGWRSRTRLSLLRLSRNVEEQEAMKQTNSQRAHAALPQNLISSNSEIPART